MRRAHPLPVTSSPSHGILLGFPQPAVTLLLFFGTAAAKLNVTHDVKQGPGRDDPPRMARQPDADDVDDAEIVGEDDDTEKKKPKKVRAPRRLGPATVARPALVGALLLAIVDAALPRGG